MSRRQREARYARRVAHQEFVRARGVGAPEGSLSGGKPPEESRSLRRRLLRAGRSQFRGRKWKKGQSPSG